MRRINAQLLSLLLSMFMLASSALSADVKPRPEESYTLYQYKASPKAIELLDKQLRLDSRFKEQGCEAIGKRAPRYVCKKNDAATQDMFAAGVGKDVRLNTVMAVCPAGCQYMRCPPPLGPYACCNQTTFMPCP